MTLGRPSMRLSAEQRWSKVFRGEPWGSQTCMRAPRASHADIPTTWMVLTLTSLKNSLYLLINRLYC